MMMMMMIKIPLKGNITLIKRNFWNFKIHCRLQSHVPGVILDPGTVFSVSTLSPEFKCGTAGDGTSR